MNLQLDPGWGDGGRKMALIREKCQEIEEKPYTHQKDPGSSPGRGNHLAQNIVIL